MAQTTAGRRLAPVILLESANFTSGLGNAVVMLALPWLVLETTGSPASAGLLAALSALPALLTSPIAGWLVDRFGRRVVSVGSDILSALAVAAIPIVGLLTDLTYPVIVLLAVIGAVFDPSGYTARRSLLPDAASAGRMSVDKLNGIHEGIFAIGWTVGPLVAAILIATVGAVSTFWAATVLFIIAALCVSMMRVTEQGQQAREAKGEAPTHFLTDLTRGFVVLWNDKLLRLLTIAVLILAAIYMPTEVVVLPTYFESLGTPQSLGIVIAALALGSTVGAFGYGWLSERFSRLAIARMIMIGTAISIIPMAFLPPLPILAATGFVLGLCWGPFNPLMSTLIQRRVPADEQGRVYGVQLSFFYTAPPVAMLMVGLAVERWGVPIVYLALAAALTLTSLAVLLAKRLREIND